MESVGNDGMLDLHVITSCSSEQRAICATDLVGKVD